jgi:hypothetical protein
MTHKIWKIFYVCIVYQKTNDCAKRLYCIKILALVISYSGFMMFQLLLQRQ